MRTLRLLAALTLDVHRLSEASGNAFTRVPTAMVLILWGATGIKSEHPIT